jgi:hypothetical protein
LKDWRAPKCRGRFNHYYGASPRGKTSEFIIRVKAENNPKEEVCEGNTKPNTTNLKRTNIANMYIKNKYHNHNDLYHGNYMKELAFNISFFVHEMLILR